MLLHYFDQLKVNATMIRRRSGSYSIQEFIRPGELAPVTSLSQGTRDASYRRGATYSSAIHIDRPNRSRHDALNARSQDVYPLLSFTRKLYAVPARVYCRGQRSHKMGNQIGAHHMSLGPAMADLGKQ
jgi:outer membrane receptor for Fe3+-dicitrate